MYFDEDYLILKGARRILVPQFDPKDNDPFPFAVVLTSRRAYRDPRLLDEDMHWLQQVYKQRLIFPIPVEQNRDGTVTALKWCPTCGDWRMRDKYHKDPTRADGLCRICQSCKNEERRRYYRESIAA